MYSLLLIGLGIVISQVHSSPGIDQYRKLYSGQKSFQSVTTHGPLLGIIGHNRSPTPAITLQTTSPAGVFIGFTATGKCLKEVPTITLVNNAFNVPRGNGSNSNLSLIEVCCEGYKANQHNPAVCDPVCKDDCINGFCKAPNQCDCFAGNVKNLADVCIPTCPIMCANGVCNPNGQCFCNSGYILEPNRKFCVPYCPMQCGLNANCTQPGICQCNAGFRLSGQICQSICSRPCGRGKCTSAGICECEPGYILKDNTCQAICSKGCIGGTCITKDVCACEPYYQLVQNRTKCEPICRNGCGIGVCIRPDICQCPNGYQSTAMGCSPVCTMGCQGGTCIAPNICQCGPGYALDNNGRVCNRVQSVQTQCSSGYKYEYGRCVAICITGCPNGICVSPGLCQCNSGYQLSTGNCIPVGTWPQYNPTSHVLNTTTIYRNHTQSPYRQSQVWGINQAPPTMPTIVIRCDRACLNGFCSGLNECTCNTGYVQQPGSFNVCIAHCAQGCPNGQCLSPNLCTCNFGFKKNNQGLCVRT